MVFQIMNNTEITVISTVVERLDIAVEKLTEVSHSVSQMLAVHENRIDQQEKVSDQLSELIERRREETEENIKILHKRITEGEKELRYDFDKKNEEILKEIRLMRDENSKQHTSVSERIIKLEKWIWVVSGGGFVVGFLLSQIGAIASLFH